MKFQIPNLPPNVGGIQAVALVSSGALMIATAGLRVAFGGFELSNIALAGCLLLWDGGVTGLVHWSGHRIAASKAEMAIYAAKEYDLTTAREQAGKAGSALGAVTQKLDEAETERTRKIEGDFDLNEVQEWGAEYIRSLYFMAVNRQRRGLFPKE